MYYTVYLGSVLQNSAYTCQEHERGDTHWGWNPGVHRDSLRGSISTKEREDCGILIDTCHGNVIFVLGNSEKGEYWELLGRD